MKPRVMSLVIFTCAVGLLTSNSNINITDSMIGITLVALGAGAAGCLNMWYEADLDALMTRTCLRPIPTGKINKQQALIFGTLLTVFSVGALNYFANFLSASLLLFTIFFYLFIYTIWLKKKTPQNIVIGGAAGAAPPVLGWTAVTGTLDPNSLLLFLIIFVWTPPHFWALAIYRRDDYAAADIPMLPVTHGVEFTRLQILLYTILLFVVTLLPYLVGMSGLFYLVGAVLLGAGFLYYAILMRFNHDDRLAMRTFSYSIIYLMLLFAFLLIDHYIPIIANNL